jgi:predicted TIM-barrel fold metal-dependent hydrolase
MKGKEEKMAKRSQPRKKKKVDENYEPSFHKKYRDDALRAYHTVESMGERLGTIGEEEVAELMFGACDLHIHCWPDPLIDTGWTQSNIAKRATDEGMAAVLFKSMTMPTAFTAPYVQEIVDLYAEAREIHPVSVFGGIVCNYYVGGLYPESVEMCARAGGKKVWLPSHDGAHHHRVMGEKGGIELLDKKGKPLKELMEILEIVKKYDLILDPCHASVKERFVVIDAARKMGIKKIMLTHPNWNVNRATIDQQVEMANRGAFVGLFMYSSVPHFNNPNGDPFEMLEIIKKVGPDRIVMSTDLGTMLNVHPVEGLKLFFRLLLALGVKKTDIEKMAKKNPSFLLGL